MDYFFLRGFLSSRMAVISLSLGVGEGMPCSGMWMLKILRWRFLACGGQPENEEMTPMVVARWRGFVFMSG